MKQKTAQRKIFKIETSRFKESKWKLDITVDLAKKLEEYVSLADSETFRLIEKILKNRGFDKFEFHDYIANIVCSSKKDLIRATSKRCPIIINGKEFKRFVGTTGGLKKNSVLFVNKDIIDELNERCECGRNKEVKLLGAKYEAYKALTCSSSTPIPNPNGILVVRDCITKYASSVIDIDDSDSNKEPVVSIKENIELENNVSDGFNLISPEYARRISEYLELDYIPSGWCIRNAWCKGMANVFDFIEFANIYGNGNYLVEDVWGNMIDIRNVEMILTESSLKLWMCYDNVEHYIESFKNSGYSFSTTKCTPKELEDTRTLNYQYLQSYEFTKKDIMELIEPTINWLKSSMGGDYESTIKFLGLDENKEENDYLKALYLDKRMIHDPYVIDRINRYIKKKINQAKIGKLIVNGNYQIASGDPFALMQSIFGLEVTGLLKAGECFSKYWYDKGAEEVVTFRSPMTSHNNIRKLKICKNEEALKWYSHMGNMVIINGWDTFCMAENGEDWDGDQNFITDNSVLLRNYRELFAIQCIQRNSTKEIVTEEKLIESNMNGMGNQVGTITNRATSMMEVLSHFDKNSSEYATLQYRILCGQLYQQNELDKIKGIVATEMPKHWYSVKEAKEKLQEDLVADKKPYFMIYIYPQLKKEYDDYIKSSNTNCFRTFGMYVGELKKVEFPTVEQATFLKWYDLKMPVGLGKCTMNNICYIVEEEMKGYKSELKEVEFDYTFLKTGRRCTNKHREELKELYEEYQKELVAFQIDSKNSKLNTEDSKTSRDAFKNSFKEKALKICPNEDEVMDILLDLCYKNDKGKQFCWDICGEYIIKHLEEINNENN